MVNIRFFLVFSLFNSIPNNSGPPGIFVGAKSGDGNPFPPPVFSATTCRWCGDWIKWWIFVFSPFNSIPNLSGPPASVVGAESGNGNSFPPPVFSATTCRWCGDWTKWWKNEFSPFNSIPNNFGPPGFVVGAEIGDGNPFPPPVSTPTTCRRCGDWIKWWIFVFSPFNSISNLSGPPGIFVGAESGDGKPFPLPVLAPTTSMWCIDISPFNPIPNKSGPPANVVGAEIGDGNSFPPLVSSPTTCRRCGYWIKWWNIDFSPSLALPQVLSDSGAETGYGNPFPLPVSSPTACRRCGDWIKW